MFGIYAWHFLAMNHVLQLYYVLINQILCCVQALNGHPALHHLLSDIWGTILRNCHPDTQLVLFDVFFKLLSDMAVGCLSIQARDDRSRSFSLLFGKLLMVSY